MSKVIFSAENFWLGRADSPEEYDKSLTRFMAEVESHTAQDNGFENSDYLYFFVYGGLMWTGEKEMGATNTQPATLDGFRRDVLMSTVFRGNPREPGMVFGLNQCNDGECRGVVLKIHKDDVPAAFEYYKKCELSAENDVAHGPKQHGMYSMVYVPVTLSDGTRINAVTVITNPLSPKSTTSELYREIQEDGDLTLRQKAWMIVRGRRRELGLTDPDTGSTTYHHLEEVGIGYNRLKASAERENFQDSGRSIHYFRNTLNAMRDRGIDDPYLEALSEEVDRVEELYRIWAKNLRRDSEKAEQAGRQLFNKDLLFFITLENHMRDGEMSKRNLPKTSVFRERIGSFVERLGLSRRAATDSYEKLVAKQRQEVAGSERTLD